MQQRSHAGTPARSEQKIREELVRTLESLPESRKMPEVAREMYVNVLPAVGALIEREREEDGSIADIRKAIILTVGQMIVDVIVMTTQRDEKMRMLVMSTMMNAILDMVEDAIGRATKEIG